MDSAWEETKGEAIHTSTFLGNPVGCAMALANLKEIERKNLVKQSSELGEKLLKKLSELKSPSEKLKLLPRGLGLMAGIEFNYNGKPAADFVFKIVKEMLQRGIIVLPESDCGNVLSFTPPLIIKWNQLSSAIDELQDVINTINQQ
jgi:4-aminobutyrate aminotransferase-like enzyme